MHRFTVLTWQPTWVASTAQVGRVVIRSQSAHRAMWRAKARRVAYPSPRRCTKAGEASTASIQTFCPGARVFPAGTAPAIASRELSCA